MYNSFAKYSDHGYVNEPMQCIKYDSGSLADGAAINLFNISSSSPIYPISSPSSGVGIIDSLADYSLPLARKSEIAQHSLSGLRHQL